MVLASINGPDGATLDYTSRYAEAIERIGEDYPEFDHVFSNVGNPTVAQGNVFLRTKPWEERTRTTQEMAREIGPRMAALPGVSAFPITPPSLGQGFRERPINYVIVTSDSYQNLSATVREFQDELAKNPGFVQVDTDLRLNKPEIRMEVDRERAADMGVSVDAIARTVETMLGGRIVTRYKRDGEQYDVMVQTVSANRSTPEDIDRLFVRGRGRRHDSRWPRWSRSARWWCRANSTTSASAAAPPSPPTWRPTIALGEALDFMDQTAREGAAAGLRDRPQRQEPRVPQLVGFVDAGVCARAVVHLPGAGGAVRELRRSVRHHAQRSAVDGWVRCWRST